jgi:hypothetical protein
MAARAAIALLIWEIARTAPVRGAIQSYVALLSAANRQDLEAARALSSAHYLETHTLAPAPEGGLIGLPRNVHKNFQAWREGDNVWVCPTNRVGPVYQFVHEGGRWKFDGPVGLLRPGGEVILDPSLAEPPDLPGVQ